MDKTVCELFAGVGGFHLGLSRAGEWQVKWANQWEPSRKVQHAFECYSQHFPETIAVNEDIALVNENPEVFKVPKYTLLVGGFPCQDYSVAATKSRGIEGKKGVLWWEIKKFLERDKPPFVLLENVDRLLKSPAKQRGRDFGVMLTCFRDLGYNVEWRVINAADYGFSQRRRRIFIFAYKHNTNYYRSIIQELNNNEFMEEYIKRNGFFAEIFPIETIYASNEKILNQDILEISNEFSFGFQEAGVLINNRIYTTRYTPKIKKPTSLREILESNVSEKFYLGEELERWTYMKGAKAEPRTTKEGFEYIYREGAVGFPDNLELPSRTMLTSEASVNRSTHVVKDPETNRLRVLTPVECERLNGFDDNWTNTGMSEKFRYFCMGNALVVGLIEIMGRKLNNIVDSENMNNESTIEEVELTNIDSNI